MFLADYHTHSHASMDGHVSITEMAQAAIHAGLQEYCITDHAECMGFFDRGHLPEHVKYFYKELVDKEFAEAQEALGSKIKLLKGIEHRLFTTIWFVTIGTLLSIRSITCEEKPTSIILKTSAQKSAVRKCWIATLRKSSRPFI